MGLSKAFSSLSGNSVKLGQLHTVPTTEDLLFVLSTAKQNKKAAELPFKNPNNQLIFSIKVIPATLQHAARWTFSRCDESGNVVLWTRESNEVMMIQGKVKIESNYTGVTVEDVKAVLEAQEVGEQAENDESGYNDYSDKHTNAQLIEEGISSESAESGEPELATPPMVWHKDLPVSQVQAEGDVQVEHAQAWPGEAWQEQVVQTPAAPVAAWENTPEHRSAWSEEADPDFVEPGPDKSEADQITPNEKKPKSKKARARAKAAAAKAAAAMVGAQPPKQSIKNESIDSADLYAPPPPAPLHSEVLITYLSSLSDPATGLLYHGAFEFFLLRDIKYVQKYGVKMSLLVFDFTGPGDANQSKPSLDVTANIGRIMCDACTPLELCTQLRSGEFAILLCGHNGESAFQFAENLCAKLASETWQSSGQFEHLAMGVACIPEHCQEPGALIAAAINAKIEARRLREKCKLFKPSTP